MSHHIRTTLIPWRRAVALIGLLALVGCESTAAPTAADSTEARQTLDKALTAWTQGATVESMGKASPPITISEPRWERGEVLTGFEITGEGKPSGAERVFPVTLKMTDAKGKAKSEFVQFRVGTNPVLTVFRSVF